MPTTPAASLEGLIIGEWTVTQKITPPPKSTGGHFSVGYLVRHRSGKEAYLKALDFSKALQSDDPARELESMTAAYNFERDLLTKCRENGMSRIVTPIFSGTVTVPGGFGDLSNVCYLIFEKADGDIRARHNNFNNLDLAWCLRSLHHTAVGMNQLHSQWIAHQDLKPSNVLVFQSDGSKVADLGRASDRFVPCRTDSFKIAGDTSYAAPEQWFGYKVCSDFHHRFAVDMYLLGSLIYFYFANVSATQAIRVKLMSAMIPITAGMSFTNVVPYIRNAFHETLIDLEKEVKKHTTKICDEIILMARQLCEPDPNFRGHPINRKQNNPFRLERYISKLDLLAKKAEYNLI